MTFLYNFGFSQEDERTEAEALGLPGGRVLSIASAGDMALSLVALGAEHVVEVDTDQAQIHLCHLKVAAVRCLSSDEAIAFLGLVPATSAERELWLQRVDSVLPPSSRAFWQANREQVARHGVIWAGRYEQFVRKVMRVIGPFLKGPTTDLVRCADLPCQEQVFSRRFDGWALRGLFRIVFHPAVFSRRGMDPRSLAHREGTLPLGEQYFRRLRAFCTATPARENPWLQLHFLGRVVGPQAVPTYLSPAGFEAARKGLANLEVVHGDVMAFLENAPDGTANRFHLSNVPDWFSQADFEALMRLIGRKTDRPARLVWRYLHVDRQLPEDLAEAIRIDRAWGSSLAGRDRFPFYSVVPATI